MSPVFQDNGMNMSIQKFRYKGFINLENGGQLENPVIAYNTYGRLNRDGSNVIWVCHALTANSDVLDWWDGLFGTQKLFDPENYFIVCANMIGSHYGSTGPLSTHPDSDEPYYHDFPLVTIRDQVKIFQVLSRQLKVEDIQLLIGASMGGQQALEWAINQPDRIKHLVLLATNAIHSPWGVAFNESQRMSIESDPSWLDKSENAGILGMKTARSVALLSYRSYETYQSTQQPSDENLIFPDRASSYQVHQGNKLAKRFNAFSYWFLSKAMDSHNVGRRRGGIDKALSRVKSRTLVLTLENDVLFPRIEQETIVRGIDRAIHQIVPTEYGHDGFLIETEVIGERIKKFLNHKDFNLLDYKRNHSVGIRVGLVGLGHVGRAFYEQSLLRDDIQISKVLVKRQNVDRDIPEDKLTYDLQSFLADDSLDVIVELIDDSLVAYTLAKACLRKGLTYISANKKMLAIHLVELKELERIYGGHLFYEASVGGAIPILRNIDAYYTSEPIVKIEAIINGSTNYILTQMSNENWSFKDALRKAQELGFAESDPSLDIEGFDAVYKATLLTYSALGKYVNPDKINRQGIQKITQEDIQLAKAKNEKIKLLVRIEDGESPKVSVGPESIDQDNELFYIDEELNGVAIKGAYSDVTLFKGRGAGGHPTASAVMADLDLAKRYLTDKVLV